MTSTLISANSSRSQDDPKTQASQAADRIALSFCDLDEFEEGLLPVLRHFMMSLAEPERQSWQFAYKIAAERWGETLGLPVANALFKLIQFTSKARRVTFNAIDPLAIEDRGFVTRDERAFLRMLHHRGRDETGRARDAVADVSACTMDPDVIRAGLSFADRFPAGDRASKYSPGRPHLQLVR
ncbi:hypothetical protein [Pseudophaeobacter leonis]|uniref:hypothetical protein n=1 Tax=Pseudophaeobacter leonis TaxID=1144477 RepID=UPI0009F641D6|nr:hypothetical protein [Pseudophaeobacter leonis]